MFETAMQQPIINHLRGSCSEYAGGVSSIGVGIDEVLRLRRLGELD